MRNNGIRKMSGRQSFSNGCSRTICSVNSAPACPCCCSSQLCAHCSNSSVSVESVDSVTNTGSKWMALENCADLLYDDTILGVSLMFLDEIDLYLSKFTGTSSLF